QGGRRGRRRDQPAHVPGARDGGSSARRGHPDGSPCGGQAAARADRTGQAAGRLLLWRPVRAGPQRAVQPGSAGTGRDHPRSARHGRREGRCGMTSDVAPLRLGTRRSLLATTQSKMVADRLTELTGRAVELVGVTTFGDVTRAHLAQLGGTGVFVSALRDKLIEGEIDFAVHSLKDLPTKPDPRTTLVAIPPRHDPRDALVGPAKLADLPEGAKVGTGSPRRVAQLRALRPDLEYVPVRGNADTRLGKVHAGELDAVVLAYAGLWRISKDAEISQVFEAEEVLPAPGQGALAVECSADREDLIELLGV